MDWGIRGFHPTSSPLRIFFQHRIPQKPIHAKNLFTNSIGMSSSSLKKKFNLDSTIFNQQQESRLQYPWKKLFTLTSLAQYWCQFNFSDNSSLKFNLYSSIILFWQFWEDIQFFKFNFYSFLRCALLSISLLLHFTLVGFIRGTWILWDWFDN